MSYKYNIKRNQFGVIKLNHFLMSMFPGDSLLVNRKINVLRGDYQKVIFGIL